MEHSIESVNKVSSFNDKTQTTRKFEITPEHGWSGEEKIKNRKNTEDF